MTIESYVAYIILPPRRNRNQVLFSNDALAAQEKRVKDFLSAKSNTQLVKTFIETADNHRYRHRWPQLSEAINYCLEQKAHFIIAEIRNLTHNDAFTKEVFRLYQAPNDFTPQIVCCDQPLIKTENFSAIVEYAQEQKKLHGELIKAGLNRSNAKSGNPHASEVITKVNKPKIESAIMFAMLEFPKILDYRMKGYSQRKMVSALNDENYTAPEGGQWVLSQLQKVLDRMKINESAFMLETKFREYKNNGDDPNTICDFLNNNGVPSPKGKVWTPECVIKVMERIDQLKELMELHEFVEKLTPILHKYHVDELTPDLLGNELKEAGLLDKAPTKGDLSLLLNRMIALMESAEKYQEFKKGNYLTIIKNGKDKGLLPDPLLKFFELQERLSQVSQNFLTPSYKTEKKRLSF